jgi:hypothetical protein
LNLLQRIARSGFDGTLDSSGRGVMASDIDAVIAALRTVLKEAETRSSDYWWKTSVVNRWIARLPGAWTGRWRHLKLTADSGFDANRPNLISHVRATLAYLETNREAIRSMRAWSWGIRASPSVPAEPIEAEFEEVRPTDAKQLPKPSKRIRAVK